MRALALLFTLLPLAQGCVPMHSDPKPCAMCPETLGNENLKDGECDARRTCVTCGKTEVKYSTSAGCRAATITCPGNLNSPRIRLLKTDNTGETIVYTPNLGVFTCTGASWKFENGQKTIHNIKKAYCFGKGAGFQGSPINIISSNTTHTKDYDASRFIVNYGERIVEWVEFHKSASGFHVHIKPNANAYFTASHFIPRYRLVEYHAHWNKDGNARGSEHRIDGIGYSAEFHFVHIREDFANFDDAKEQNGVAVIGVLAELSPESNPKLDPLIEAINKCSPLANITACKLDATKDGILQQDPAELIPMDHNYFAYTGSLTTGGFEKCVEWNVLTTRIKISQDQLNVLGELIDTNFRPDVSIEDETTVYTSVSKSRRNPITEEAEEEKKELETSTLTRSPSFVQEEDEEEEEDAVEDKEDSSIIHRLKQKYKRKMSELRSKLLEWTN